MDVTFAEATSPVVLAAIAVKTDAETSPESMIETVASDTTTSVSSVTKAAVTSAAVPLIAIAFVTVTTPLVAPPTAERVVASTAVRSSSLIVTFTASRLVSCALSNAAFTSDAAPVIVVTLAEVTAPDVRPAMSVKTVAAIEPVSLRTMASFPSPDTEASTLCSA